VLKLIMKKIILFLVIFILVAYLLVSRSSCQNKLAKIYSIDNKNYCLLTASNQKQWKRGLMFYKKSVNIDGMIFIFPNKDYRSFWNENTYLDLDVYWMDGDKILGKSFLPSINKSKTVITVDSPGEADRVVEIIF